MLAEKAHYDHSVAGYLHKRTADSAKWQQRWFVLYQVRTACNATLVPRLFKTSFYGYQPLVRIIELCIQFFEAKKDRETESEIANVKEIVKKTWMIKC